MEVNDELIKEILKMANMPDSSDVSEADLVSALYTIKNAKQESAPSKKTEEAKEEFVDQSELTNNVLVVDDIGVVTYQLKIIMQKFGYNVQTAKDVFSALNAFSKDNFDIVIMDLFVSTEQEGYTLLTEIKKIMSKRKHPTKVIVITASNKSENKLKCLNLGADEFLKKETGWQNQLEAIIEKCKFGE